MKESCYLRLVSIPCDIPYNLPEGYQLAFGRGAVLVEGKDAILFSYGPVMLSHAWHAAQKLATQGIGLQVVNLPWLNRIDASWLANMVNGYKWIFTLDNHYVVGGQGTFVLNQLAQTPAQPGRRAVQLGLHDIPSCGTND